MKTDIDKFWELLNEAGWEGYIWRVSSNKAEIYSDQSQILKTEPTEVYNRIQEANFYNAKKNLSLNVKNIDGEELAFCYKNDDYSVVENYKIDQEPMLVPSAKPELPKFLKFKNLYQKQGSKISSEEYKSWIQVAQIFVGFKN